MWRVDFHAMFTQGFSDHIDPVMQSEAATWYMVDWAAWGVGFIACLILLIAIPSRPGEPPRARPDARRLETRKTDKQSPEPGLQVLRFFGRPAPILMRDRDP